MELENVSPDDKVSLSVTAIPSCLLPGGVWNVLLTDRAMAGRTSSHSINCSAD